MHMPGNSGVLFLLFHYDSAELCGSRHSLKASPLSPAAAVVRDPSGRWLPSVTRLGVWRWQTASANSTCRRGLLPVI